MKKQAKRGRPTRAAASAKALKNVDPTTVDPRLILQQIAADRSAPATARVGACRALLNEGDPSKQAEDVDQVTSLALKLLRGNKP